MDHNPLVTVIIPVHNAGEYLRPAVESIINQSYENLEIIIVDDGSTDGCMDSIFDLIAKDARVITLQQQNSGKSVALNRAMDVMHGEFWGIQDADDISYPERIEKQLVVLLEKKELAAVYVGHDLLVEGRQYAPTFRQKETEECKKGILAFTMPAHDATGLYRVSMVGEFRFEPDLRIGQGIDYVLRVGEKYPVLLAGECLYTYRVNYLSTIRKNPQQNIEWISLVMQKACQRRGTVFKGYRLNPGVEYKNKKRSTDNHIISHSMESVIDLKGTSRLWEALEVGFICCMLNPFDWYYYKPMVYGILPLKLISLYRACKAKPSKIK